MSEDKNFVQDDITKDMSLAEKFKSEANEYFKSNHI